MKINDFVFIKGEKPNSINYEARIVAIEEDGVRVSNLNMPFLGTYAYKFFRFDEISYTPPA